VVAVTLAAQSSGVKIVVISGEDGVNIIGKGTAVAPVVEVRDRNDLPVAGASVVFLIGGGGARFANNATSVTVATDAGGRATATGMKAIGKGVVRVQVQATYQGETATATVTQTNFAGVAEAAQAGKSVTNPQGSANGASQGAAQGSHHIGLITAGAGAAVGGIVARNALSGQGSNCEREALLVGDAFDAFATSAQEYGACVSRGLAAACTPLKNASVATGQRFVDANGAYCACTGSTARLTTTDLDVYTQNLLAGHAELAAFNCGGN
jgi:hypothetical protein